MTEKIESIILGGGCFWCIETVFKRVLGVRKVTSGYSGGESLNPTYQEVCSGRTGHAEVVKVEYNPSTLPLEKILGVFFHAHDPTSLNRQGPDTKEQYRSIILWTKLEQKEIIEKFIEKVKRNFKKPIVTEVGKLEKFYPAEEYHQNYFAKNPEPQKWRS